MDQVIKSSLETAKAQLENFRVSAVLRAFKKNAAANKNMVEVGVVAANHLVKLVDKFLSIADGGKDVTKLETKLAKQKADVEATEKKIAEFQSTVAEVGNVTPIVDFAASLPTEATDDSVQAIKDFWAQQPESKSKK